MEAKVLAAEARLQDVRARNAGMERKAQLLERALQSKRAQYVRSLRLGFRSGAGDPAVAASGAADAGLAPEAVPEPPLDGWRSFEARVPKARKCSARPALRGRLRDAGVQDADLDGEQVGGHAEEELLWLLKASSAHAGGGLEARARWDTPDLSMGSAFAAALLDGLPLGRRAHSDRQPLDDGCLDGGRDGTEDGAWDGTFDGAWATTRSASQSSRPGRGSPTPRTEGEGPWRLQACLRSHLDGVRAVLAMDDVLLSCGEDTTIKAWDAAFLRDRNTTPQQWEDLEPYATYRGHASAVLCLACSAEDHLIYSGGKDGTVRAWRFLAPTDYDPYEASPIGQKPIACLRHFVGHTDAVWSLGLHPHLRVLASAGADGTVRLWDPEDRPDREPILRVLELTPRDGGSAAEQPTSVAWVMNEDAMLLAGYASSRCAIFDVDRSTVVVEAQQTGGSTEAAVTSVACHPLTDLAVSGHVDRTARLFSASSGQLVSTLSGHGDVVTSVALDPAGGYEVVTGSHDGCIRVFDIRNGQCLQQSRLHTPKFDEALHCVFHSGDRLVTGGADANVVVLGLAA